MSKTQQAQEPLQTVVLTEKGARGNLRGLFQGAGEVFEKYHGDPERWYPGERRTLPVSVIARLQGECGLALRIYTGEGDPSYERRWQRPLPPRDDRAEQVAAKKASFLAEPFVRVVFLGSTNLGRGDTFRLLGYPSEVKNQEIRCLPKSLYEQVKGHCKPLESFDDANETRQLHFLGVEYAEVAKKWLSPALHAKFMDRLEILKQERVSAITAKDWKKSAELDELTRKTWLKGI